MGAYAEEGCWAAIVGSALRTCRRVIVYVPFLRLINKLSEMTDLKSLLCLLCGVAAMMCHAQTYTPIANMPQATMRHTATLLADGKVLAVRVDGATQIFDPVPNQWMAGAAMAVGSTDHTATRLVDGSVLVAGGFSSSTSVGLARAERYDPVGGTWGSAGTLAYARTSHAAANLVDGTVLIVGGEDRLGTPTILLSSVERYTPSTNTWSVGPELPAPRAEHTTTVLQNGDVIVLGGTTAAGGSSDCLRLPHATSVWIACASMPNVRVSHKATLLSDGRIFVTGGTASATSATTELLFDPASNTWFSTSMSSFVSTGGVSGSRFSFSQLSFRPPGHVVFELVPGAVVVWGGSPWDTFSVYGDRATVSSGASVYYVSSNTTAQLRSFPALAGQTATPLLDGRMLIAGGFTAYSCFASLGTFCSAVPAASSGVVPQSRASTSLALNVLSGQLPWSPMTGDRYDVSFLLTPTLFGGPPPTGTVAISDGSSSCLAALPLRSCALTATFGGPRTYSLTYVGDAVYSPASTTGSAPSGDLLRIQLIRNGTVGALTSTAGGVFGTAYCGRSNGPFPDQCDLTVVAGASTTLTPTVSSGVTFIGWQGACSGTASSCSVQMPATGSMVVKAYFVPTSMLPLTADFDGDGTKSAATDGALLMRYLRRLHDGALTNAVLGTGAQRTDPNVLEARITAMSPLLDVDGNGQVDAATDGIIILRYLLGVRGDALVANALAADARRTDVASITAALVALSP